MTLSQSDIARLLGISRSTVSRALADSPLVSEEMKRKVRRACEDLGYHPDYIASSMSTKETRMISVIAGAYPSDIHSRWIQHLRHEVIGAGYKFRWDEIDDLDKVISERSADGLIVFGGQLEQYGRPLAAQKGVNSRKGPVMIATDCRSYDDTGEKMPNSVSNDNVGGSQKAVEYLVSMGHRAIGFFGLLPNGVCKERYAGYVKALNDAGLPAPEQLTISQHRWSSEYEDYRSCSRELFEMIGQGATAVLASTDVGTVAVVKLLREAGFEVPGDVSVVGFDDTVLTRFWEPRITVVRQDLAEASRIAVEMLLRCMKTRETQPGVVVPVSLDVGGSACPPKECR